MTLPRHALVVFTGISGSGKSSLAFGTLFAEAQRRYLESVAPYARRLFDQVGAPQVDDIEGLPPAVALQQQRGSPTSRSSVGSITTLSNLLRMLYARAGDYPRNQPLLHAEAFSPNTPEGACSRCQGQGRTFEVTEQSMVPDPSLSIRQRAIAAWPPAWHGQNLRDILVTLGYDIDCPWHKLNKKDRAWILFTEDQPTVPVYAGYEASAVKKARSRREPPSYQGTFTGAKRYVLHTFAHTQSALMKRRVSQFLVGRACSQCRGKRLRPEALSVKFAGLNISEMSNLPLSSIKEALRQYVQPGTQVLTDMAAHHPEKALVAQRIGQDLWARLAILLDLGLGYLSLERATPSLSPGELQRLRLATQIRSNLFGVVYVLDEPSAGLHPVDTAALLAALRKLKAAGNSLFVVEHDIDVIQQADWLVDVGPGAGAEGGQVLYSGPPNGLKNVEASHTRPYLFAAPGEPSPSGRQPSGWLQLTGITCNNLDDLSVRVPLGVFTAVTGVSGSGKSTLISQALQQLVAQATGDESLPGRPLDDAPTDSDVDIMRVRGTIGGDVGKLAHLVTVDQRPIGRTPRSNLATYTGLFDYVRKLFAGTPKARRRHFDAGHFSFNVPKGRCKTCEGDGCVAVELLFMASVYAPCPACHGARYHKETLAVTYRDASIADVLAMTVGAAAQFFASEPQIMRSLQGLLEVGLGYLRLGQPATELSGGEAQRIKLATELQRSRRAHTLYILDEPTAGLHPADVDKLWAQLSRLVDAGNTVVVVEHELRMVAKSDWVIDIGPGGGSHGGKIVAEGTPQQVAQSRHSVTAPYLARHIAAV